MRLDVSIPLHHFDSLDEMFAASDHVTAQLEARGFERTDSGTGLGYRDLGFSVPAGMSADDAEALARPLLPDDARISASEDDQYDADEE
jgi:hypothetical protein